MLSAENAYSHPESISGVDKRVKIDPNTAPPYNWICSLVIRDVNGKRHKGSGFKIHMPNINCSIVVTCGHCVFLDGECAENICVTFPGYEPILVEQADLYAYPEYIQDSNRDYDYGFIILSGNSNEGFGWSAIVPDSKLLGRIVNSC